MEINQEQRKAWVTNPVTQEVLERLKEEKQDALVTWGKRGFVGETPEATLIKNASALGAVDVLQQMIDLIEDYGNE